MAQWSKFNSADFLKPNIDPGYCERETRFLDIVEAIERLESRESYRSVADDTSNITRPALMNIHKDEERRAWYLEGEAEDDRVAEAVQGVELK